MQSSTNARFNQRFQCNQWPNLVKSSGDIGTHDVRALVGKCECEMTVDGRQCGRNADIDTPCVSTTSDRRTCGSQGNTSCKCPKKIKNSKFNSENFKILIKTFCLSFLNSSPFSLPGEFGMSSSMPKKYALMMTSKCGVLCAGENTTTAARPSPRVTVHDEPEHEGLVTLVGGGPCEHGDQKALVEAMARTRIAMALIISGGLK
jgi:hypothetical protein